LAKLDLATLGLAVLGLAVLGLAVLGLVMRSLAKLGLLMRGLAMRCLATPPLAVLDLVRPSLVQPRLVKPGLVTTASRWTLCAALCTAWLSGCGTRADVGPASSNAMTGQSTQAFLEKIPDAPMKVAYVGLRHFSLNYKQGEESRVLEYDENVTSDGRGKFSIVPGQVLSPRMTAEQSQIFAILQENRDGFFYRYRDFRIRDWKTFRQTWRVNDTGVQETIAGRDTAVLEIRRIQDGTGPSAMGRSTSNWYRAWIDPETGLVMRADEFDVTGALVSRVEFLTFTLTPDLSAAVLHGDRMPGVPLDMKSDTTGSLGFQVLTPTILPEGYRLEKAESLSDGTSTWARLVFGDGVEQLFFLQTLAVPGQPGSAAGLHRQVDVGPNSVLGFHVGAWTVLQGQFHDLRAIVVGKTDGASLARMLKSAAH
jgi:hypothetical protein